jgi:phosphoribosylaminoimidazole carboxylase (NCAIR synthetase)
MVPMTIQQSATRNPQSPNWTAVLAHHPALKLHLYGKTEARPGRKMGHITALADTGEEAALIVREARRKIARLEIRDWEPPNPNLQSS